MSEAKRFCAAPQIGISGLIRALTSDEQEAAQAWFNRMHDFHNAEDAERALVAVGVFEGDGETPIFADAEAAVKLLRQRNQEAVTRLAEQVRAVNDGFVLSVPVDATAGEPEAEQVRAVNDGFVLSVPVDATAGEPEAEKDAAPKKTKKKKADAEAA